MKSSVLILKLQEIIRTHGDLEVVLQDWMSEGRFAKAVEGLVIRRAKSPKKEGGAFQYSKGIYASNRTVRKDSTVVELSFWLPKS